MYKKKTDFPKLRGKAAEIKDMAAAVRAMWGHFGVPGQDFQEIGLLLDLTCKFEEILEEWPIADGYFCLPAEAADRLKTNFRDFACLYVMVGDRFRSEDRRAFNPTEKKDNALFLSRARAAWRSARTLLLRAEHKKQAGEAVEELECALEPSTQETLLQQFHATYKIEIDVHYMPCDPLLGRLYREFQRLTPTVISVFKIKSLYWAAKPHQDRTIVLGDQVKLQLDRDEAVPVRSVMEYYRGLRILANGYAIVGQHRAPSKQMPGTEVVFAPLSDNLRYADSVLRIASSCDLPAGSLLEWVRARDEQTRARMIELIRTGWAQGEALCKSWSEHELTWMSASTGTSKRPLHEDVPGARGSPDRKKIKTAKLELCKRWNDNRGCDGVTDTTLTRQALVRQLNLWMQQCGGLLIECKDGDRLHAADSWTGDKWGITCYSNQDLGLRTESQRQKLLDLGFPLPALAPRMVKTAAPENRVVHFDASSVDEPWQVSVVPDRWVAYRGTSPLPQLNWALPWKALCWSFANIVHMGDVRNFRPDVVAEAVRQNRYSAILVAGLSFSIVCRTLLGHVSVWCKSWVKALLCCPFLRMSVALRLIFSKPVTISAGSFGWTARLRNFWGCCNGRSLDSLPELHPPKGIKAVATERGWSLRWQDKKPWPPHVAFSDRFKPQFDATQVARSAEDLPCFPVFTRVFQRPPDRGDKHDVDAAQRFLEDGSRLPLFNYRADALLWRAESDSAQGGKLWRVPSSSERMPHVSGGKCFPCAILHACTLHFVFAFAPMLLCASGDIHWSRKAERHVRTAAAGTVWQPGVVESFPGVLIWGDLAPLLQASLRPAGVELPPLTASADVNRALARLQIYWVDTQLRNLGAGSQGPEWLQQRSVGNSKRSLGSQAGGPNSKGAVAPFLPPGLGKDCHMQFSVCLPNPFDTQALLDDDAMFACRAMAALGPCIRSWRQIQARALRLISRFLQPWEHLLQRAMPKMYTMWPDCTVGLRFVTGFRLLGAIESPGIFRDLEPTEVGSIGLPALLGPHAVDIVNRLEASLPRMPYAEEAKAFTADEIKQGIAEGPFSRQELDRRWGPGGWIPMRRFMLVQANKLRAIDDGKYSGHNKAVFAEETIFTSSPDFVAAACKACMRLLLAESGELPSWAEPHFGADDMASAYRQLPNLPEEAAALFVAHFDAHPYGMAAAVLNFNRVPALMTAAGRRMVGVCATNYFDDSGVLDFVCARGSGQSALLLLYDCAGLVLDPAKQSPMASQRPFLGVLLDLCDFAYGSCIQVNLKPGLRETLSEEIDEILQKGLLTPGEAAKLRGKFTWAASAMFGRCGRGGQHALIQRQYHDDSYEIGPELRAALEFLQALVQTVQPRNICLNLSTPAPIIIYTDASWEPKDMDRPGLGFVFCHPDRDTTLAGATTVTDDVLALFEDRQTQIFPLEALAILQCFVIFARAGLSNRDILLFCDNQSVCASVAKGACSVGDVAQIITLCHLLWARLNIRLWIEYVPSADNPSDGLSRNGLRDDWTAQQGWDMANYDCLPWPVVAGLPLLQAPDYLLQHWRDTLEIRP
ncbi:unnamed protein product [Symbiodinium sp. CCMP2592]|nr:unnamed protein product [Symbiodinium sp. CCMP2592]